MVQGSGRPLAFLEGLGFRAESGFKQKGGSDFGVWVSGFRVFRVQAFSGSGLKSSGLKV